MQQDLVVGVGEIPNEPLNSRIDGAGIHAEVSKVE